MASGLSLVVFGRAEEIRVGLAATAMGAVGFGEELTVGGVGGEFAPGEILAAAVVDVVEFLIDVRLIVRELDEEAGGAEERIAGEFPGLLGE
jgi:hypothetical protein